LQPPVEPLDEALLRPPESAPLPLPLDEELELLLPSETQLPPKHVALMNAQLEHVPPPLPHSTSLVPAWHVPVLSQQPHVQVARHDPALELLLEPTLPEPPVELPAPPLLLEDKPEPSLAVEGALTSTGLPLPAASGTAPVPVIWPPQPNQFKAAHRRVGAPAKSICRATVPPMPHPQFLSV
jgi:hypothetical protein